MKFLPAPAPARKPRAQDRCDASLPDSERGEQATTGSDADREGPDLVVAEGSCRRAGKARLVKLVQASDTPVRRHTKIKGAANPFDPDWELYFEKRLGLIVKDSLKGRRRLLNLWRTQNGRCPNCHEPITKTTGWHVHYILPKTQGSMDNLANLVFLHPNCHQQVHSLERREQPAPIKRDFTEA